MQYRLPLSKRDMGQWGTNKKSVKVIWPEEEYIRGVLAGIPIKPFIQTTEIEEGIKDPKYSVRKRG